MDNMFPESLSGTNILLTESSLLLIKDRCLHGSEE